MHRTTMPVLWANKKPHAGLVLPRSRLRERNSVSISPENHADSHTACYRRARHYTAIFVHLATASGQDRNSWRRLIDAVLQLVIVLRGLKVAE